MLHSENKIFYSFILYLDLFLNKNTIQSWVTLTGGQNGWQLPFQSIRICDNSYFYDFMYLYSKNSHFTILQLPINNKIKKLEKMGLIRDVPIFSNYLVFFIIF